MANELMMTCQLNMEQVPASAGPRLVYLLIDTRSGLPVNATAQVPVNLGLVLDISESMRLPVLNQQQFEELVRMGHVKEVISDGIPVWTFPHIPDHIRRNAPSNLDAVKQALRDAVAHIEPHDRVSLVVFAGTARDVLTQVTGRERDRIPEVVETLDALQLGDETMMGAGIASGLAAVQRGGSAGLLTRLIVLTDGYTKDVDRCRQLAQQARAAGIAVSTMGIGTDFNERLLTEVADESQGNAYFAKVPNELPPAFAQELAAVQSIAIRHLAAQVRLSAGVELRRAHRVRPAIATLRDVEIQDRVASFDLGDLESDHPPALLLELIVPSRGTGMFRIAQVTLSYDLPGPPGGSSGAQSTCEALLEYTRDTAAPPLNPVVMNIVERVTAFSLQTRALDDAAAGNIQGATAKLRSAATRLLDMGEVDLANAAEQEAQRLEQSGQVSSEGAKKLHYATRRLSDQVE
jgi:Ca-activated chloride channel family protein